MKKGVVHLVGAGPGHEGLITVRGLELIRTADAILHDRLANPLLLRHARGNALLLDAGRWSRKDPRRQPRIHFELERLARRGMRVVRLKGGDPFIFGRGAEEAEFLRSRRIPFEIVPAPTAACAAAFAGIPLTHRRWSSKVTLLTGHRADGGAIDVSNVPRDGTLVVYMGVEALAQVSRRLIDAGWDPRTPSAVIEWASRGCQRVVEAPLDRIAARAVGQGIRTPAMTVVGKVVRLRRRLAWFESKPLFGRTVVVTRAEDRTLADRLVDAGADVLWLPSVRIEPARSPRGLARALRTLKDRDALVFSSRTAVRLFFEAVRASGRDARSVARARIVAIGPGTAAGLAEFGLRADRIAREHTTRTLARTAAREVRRGASVLYPCAAERNPEVARTLRRHGAVVEELVLYRIRPVRQRGAARVPSGALVTLASALTARSFLAEAGRRKDLRLICIGPVTARAVRAAGLRPAAVARPHDLDGLYKAVLAVARRG